MTKYYCDMCGKEMNREKQSVLGRVCRKLKSFRVEIMTCKDGVWNSAYLCTKCVLLICNKGKDL